MRGRAWKSRYMAPVRMVKLFVAVTFQGAQHIAHGAFHTRCGITIPDDLPLTAWRTYSTDWRPADCCRACFFGAADRASRPKHSSVVA